MGNPKRYFKTQDGTSLYRKSWGKASKGVIVLLHGFSDHIERYPFLVKTLSERGFCVEGFDFRGCGQSEGLRGFMTDFHQYIADLHVFLQILEQEYLKTPIFLLGHHQGGHVALRFGIEHSQAKLQGIVASSPLLGFASKRDNVKTNLAPFANLLYPKFTIAWSTFEQDLSHDLEVIEDIRKDKLRLKHATARWFSATKEAIKDTLDQANQFRFPLLLQQAGKDKIVDKLSGIHFYQLIQTSNKRRIEYPGYLHEIYNETPDRRGPVFEDLIGWLIDNLPTNRSETS